MRAEKVVSRRTLTSAHTTTTELRGDRAAPVILLRERPGSHVEDQGPLQSNLPRPKLSVPVSLAWSNPSAVWPADANCNHVKESQQRDDHPVLFETWQVTAAVVVELPKLRSLRISSPAAQSCHRVNARRQVQESTWRNRKHGGW